MAATPNPTPRTVAQVMALMAKLPQGKQYPNRQACLVATHPALAAPTAKGLCSASRQVLRGLPPQLAVQVFGNGVVSGYTAVSGTAITPGQWCKAYKLLQAQGAQARTAAAVARATHGRKAGQPA